MKTILDTEIDKADEALYFDRRAACRASNDACSAVFAAEAALREAKAALKAAEKIYTPIRKRFLEVEDRWLMTPSGGRLDDYIYSQPRNIGGIVYGEYLKRKAAREAAGIKTAAA